MPDDYRQNDLIILAKLDGFRELFEAHRKNIDERYSGMEKRLDNILEQTKKTNGRVTSLEMIEAEVRGKAKISGILWGGAASVVISVIAFLFNKQVT